jgi:hypothetical protein
MPNRLLERLTADYSGLEDRYQTIIDRIADEGRQPNEHDMALIEGLRSEMTPLAERVLELRAIDDQRRETLRVMTSDGRDMSDPSMTSLVDGSGGGAPIQTRRRPPSLHVGETQLRSFMEAIDQRRSYNEPIQGSKIENRAPVVTPSGAQVPIWYPPEPSGVEQRLAERVQVREAAASNVAEYLATTAPAVFASVAEGAPKPDSGLVVSRRSAAIVKGAAFSDVSWEMLSDFDSVQSLVTVELQSGLIRFENAEIIAAIQADPGVLAPTISATSPLLSVFQAKQAVRGAANVGLPDLCIMHPADFAIVAAELASTSGLLLGGEQAVTTGPQEMLWGMTVVQSVAATKTQVLLGVSSAAAFFLREGPRLLVDMYSQSTNNLNRIILEERFGAGVLNPGRWAKFTLPGGALQEAGNGGRTGSGK